MPDCLELISQKLKGRLELLPGRLGSDNGVRRVFGFFDTHGRAALTPEDFRTGLRKYALLVFERKLWQELVAVLFPGGDELTMARFAELFMPSGEFTTTNHLAQAFLKNVWHDFIVTCGSLCLRLKMQPHVLA